MIFNSKIKEKIKKKLEEKEQNIYYNFLNVRSEKKKIIQYHHRVVLFFNET